MRIFLLIAVLVGASALPAVPTKKALVVRGGGSIGPISPTVAAWASAVGGFGSCRRNDGGPKTALATYWNGGDRYRNVAHQLVRVGDLCQSFMLSGMLLQGVDSVSACKACVASWGVSLLKYSLDYSNGILVTVVPIVFMCTMMAMLGYCGYIRPSAARQVLSAETRTAATTPACGALDRQSTETQAPAGCAATPERELAFSMRAGHDSVVTMWLACVHVAHDVITIDPGAPCIPWSITQTPPGPIRRPSRESFNDPDACISA